MLLDALTSLTQLNRPSGCSVEIVVIDNASTDETPQVVTEVAKTSPIAVRSFREDKQGIVHARNRGVAEAQGAWIAFFDDDQLADANWLVELHAAAIEKGVQCVGGAVTLRLPEGTSRDLSPICRMLLGETVGRDTARWYDHRFTPGTGNLMLHRDVFERVGAFNPDFHQRGEDTDLFLRALSAGIRAWYTPAAVIHHVIPPERLSDAFLLRLSHVMAEGMAADERNASGRWKYPFIWSARLIQFAGVLFPRWLWAGLRRHREAQLGARCRLAIAAKTLRDGSRLMFTSNRQLTVDHTAEDQPETSPVTTPNTNAA